MQLRWGICGSGLVAGDFAKAISLLPDEEHIVTAVAGSSWLKADSFLTANYLHHARAHGSYSALFQDPDVDAVYVALRHHQHHEAVMGALAGGKAVLCEKPLGVNLAEVKEMVESAKARGTFLMEGFWTKFFPAYQKMAASIESGEVGRPVRVMANFGYKCHPPSQKKERVLSAEQGGGILLDIGCYLVMLAVWVFKEEPLSVSAVGDLFEDKGVDDTSGLTLEFSGGRKALVVCSGRANLPNRAVVLGDNGERISIEDHVSAPLKIKTPSGFHVFPLPQGHDALRFRYIHGAGHAYQATHVRDCLMQGLTESPVASLRESLIISRILEEARRQLGRLLFCEM